MSLISQNEDKCSRNLRPFVGCYFVSGYKWSDNKRKAKNSLLWIWRNAKETVCTGTICFSIKPIRIL